MLKFYESKVAHVLQQLENEGTIHEDDTNYEDMANLVRERIGNFNSWKISKRRLRGVGQAVKGIEIELMDALSESGESIEGAFRLRSDPVEAARLVQTHFGDIATHNQYRAIQSAIAKSGPNHTDEVRNTLLEHFPEDHNIAVIEDQLFHLDNWEPVE